MVGLPGALRLARSGVGSRQQHVPALTRLLWALPAPATPADAVGAAGQPRTGHPGLVCRAVGHMKAMNSWDLTHQSCSLSREAVLKTLGAPGSAGEGHCHPHVSLTETLTMEDKG